MKTDAWDGLAILFYIVCAGFSVSAIAMAHPWLFSYFSYMTGMVEVVSFFLIYSLISLLYSKISRRIFPLEKGNYEMTGLCFRMWKHRAMVDSMARSFLNLFVPMIFKPIFYKLFGTKISGQVVVSGDLADPELTTIMDGAIIGRGSIVTGHMMTYDRFIVNPVIIGRKVTIGINSVISPGVVVEEGAVVMAGAVVSPNTRIPKGEAWGGVPAKCVRPSKKIARVTPMITELAKQRNIFQSGEGLAYTDVEKKIC